MSRSRARKKHELVRPTPSSSRSGATALAERAPILLPLPDEIYNLAEARRAPRSSRKGPRSISQAWDDTEALGITADMRRSGPGMLSDQDRKDTLYKAYLNSIWISACVDVIAKRITSGGYSIEYTGDAEQPTPEEEKQKEQLKAFVEYTNDDEDFLQLVRSIITDVLIYGESYVEIVKQSSAPYSLHKIDCITMNYKLDRHGNVTKYIQNLYHSTETIEFEPDEILRFWLPSPNASKIALSPIERIMGSIDADVHMADWVRGFFRKGARPNFWIKFPGPKEEADRFVVWLRENYTGMANAHVPLVLFDEAELYEIGKGSVDIDFLKGREQMCKEILAAYQVPPALVGLIESGNIGGGTGESQEKSFLRNACDPLRAMFFGQVNYRIVRQGFGIKCWRLSTHYADFREETVIAEIQDKRIRNGSLNINEVRRDMDRPAVDGGDVNVVMTTREIQPLDRLDDLSDEQKAQTEAATQHVQAQAVLAQAQADKLKEPPAPPPVPPAHLVPPGQATGQPQEAPPARAKAGQANQEEAVSTSIDALIERLDRRTYSEDVQSEAERLLLDLLNRYRQLAPDPQGGITPLASRVDEALAGIDELRSIIQVQKSASKPTRTRRKMVLPLIETAQQPNTGVMVAFMLDPETAQQIALPGGELASALHITLAFLGDMYSVDFGRHVLDLQQALSDFARDRSPLQGKIAGLGRFKSPEGAPDPIIALPDIPDLPAFRQDLVSMLAQVGCPANNEHGYTPHITLAYVDSSTPTPVESLPDLPLTFNAICLAIGDSRSYYPFGGPYESSAQSDTEADRLSEESTLEDALAAWQRRATEDVRTGAWRVFESTLIEPALHEHIRGALYTCKTPEEVQAVFERARGSEVVKDKDDLKQQIHELFSGIAERGHKTLGEENADV